MREEVRILVCGGRDFDNVELMRQTLSPYRNKWAWPIAIISGMAKGADRLGWEYAQGWGLKRYEFPADWDKYDKKAGPIRNQQMIDEGHPDLVIAFPTAKSRGTYGMIRRAEKAGIRTIIVKE